MDIASLVGPIIAIGLIIMGFSLEGGHISSLLQITAAMIVFGGAFGSMFVAFPLSDYIFAFKEISTWLKNPSINPETILKDIIDLAQTARKESILALEKKRSGITFEPLSQAVKLAVDGTDPNIIRETLETEKEITFEEQEVAAKFWEDLGGIAPTIGILGAVLGLIHVMENLDKPDQIGPGIAVAFTATLYGVGSANILFIPMGKKLKRKYALEAHARDMVIVGIEGILSGLNPRIIEEKLSIYTHGKKQSEE